MNISHTILDSNFERMLLQTCALTGKTREQVMSDVRKFADEGYSSAMRTDSLMLYLYMKNVLHVNYNVIQKQTISDVKNSPLTSHVDIEGYLVNVWLFMTTTKKRALGFTILDKTGVIDGLIFFPNVLHNWAELNFVVGDYVKLSKVVLNKWQDIITLRPGVFTTFAKIVPPYGIEETVVKLSDTKILAGAVIYTVPIWTETFTYVGCPECTVKLDVQEGVETTCVGKRSCGTVVARNIELVKGIVTDGQNDLSVNFVAKLVPTLKPEFISGSQFALMFGTYDNKLNVFIVQQILKYGRVEIKEEERRDISIEDLKKGVMSILANWKGDLPRDVLIEYVAELMNVSKEKIEEVLKIMREEGSVAITGM